MDEWLMLLLGLILIIVGIRTRQEKQRNDFLSLAMIIVGALLVLANFFDILT